MPSWRPGRTCRRRAMTGGPSVSWNERYWKPRGSQSRTMPSRRSATGPSVWKSGFAAAADPINRDGAPRAVPNAAAATAERRKNVRRSTVLTWISSPQSAVKPEHTPTKVLSQAAPSSRSSRLIRTPARIRIVCPPRGLGNPGEPFRCPATPTCRLPGDGLGSARRRRTPQGRDAMRDLQTNEHGEKRTVEDQAGGQ